MNHLMTTMMRRLKERKLVEKIKGAFKEPEDLRSCREKIADSKVKLPDGLADCIVYVVENHKILAVTKNEIKYIHKLVMAGAITALKVSNESKLIGLEDMWSYRIYA